MAVIATASTAIYAQRKGKPRVKCIVRISKPTRTKHGDHMCRVEFRGLVKPHDVHGVGSLQALTLAVTYVQLRLRLLIDRGWVFYFGPNDRKPFDFLKTWFPHQSMPGWRSNTSLERTRER